MVDLSFVVLLGGAIWLVCGSVLGYFGNGRKLSEFAVLFIALGVLVSGIGLTTFLPERRVELVLLSMLVAFALLPIVATAYLLYSHPKPPLDRSDRSDETTDNHE